MQLFLYHLLLAVLQPPLTTDAKARTAAIIEVSALLAFANVEVHYSVVGWCRRSRDGVQKLKAIGCRFLCEPAAIGMAAVNLKLSARYVRTNPTLEEFRLAPLDSSASKLRAGLICAERLILDDFGIAPIPEQAKEDLLETLEGRIDQRATMVIGQLDPSEWHGYLDSPHLADAVMDRLVQRAHRIAVRGESMRQRR